MAITKEIWENAKLLFEHGKSLSEISKETGINKSSISKKAKAESWEKFNDKSTLVLSEVDTILKQDEINLQKSTLNQRELNLHNEEVRNKLRYKKTINSNAELMASKIPLLIDAFSSVDEETGNDVFLMPPKDLKDLADANDKISITLGVNERFAQKGDLNVNTQNNIDTTTHTVTFEKK